MKKLFFILIILLSFVGILSAYNDVFMIQGTPGITQSETVTDAVQTLATGLGTDIITKNGKTVLAVTISCETYGIRYAFGVNPSTTFGHILYPGQTLYIANTAAIRNFRYINLSSGNAAKLHITPEY